MKFVESTLQVKSDEIHDQQKPVETFQRPKNHPSSPASASRDSLEMLESNGKKHHGTFSKNMQKNTKKLRLPRRNTWKCQPKLKPSQKLQYSLRITKNYRFPLSTKVCKLSSLAVIFPNCSSIKSPKTFTENNPPQTFRTSHPTPIPTPITCLPFLPFQPPAP